MKKFTLILSALLLVCGANLFAQAKKISGSVRDENGDVLPGAIVVIKSAKSGATTHTVFLASPIY